MNLVIDGKKEIKRHDIINFISFVAIILVIVLLESIQIFLDMPLRIIFLLTNFQILVLLITVYKFLYKGLFFSLFVNIASSIQFLLKYLSTDEFLYLEMVYYRLFTIIIAIFICSISIKQKKYSNKIENNNFIDSVTDTFNHRYFQERLDLEVKRANRIRNALGIIMIDIDRFKTFNETFGHREGDAYLSYTANVIKSSLRIQDILCRYGGDEFAIILPDLKKNKIEALIEKIQKNYETQLNNYSTRKGKSIRITISMGYSIYPDLATTPDELISQADNALYHAKQTGRNNIKIYKDVFNNIKGFLNETETQLLTSLKTLLGTISAKDHYTLGHSERVMEYSSKIGEAMKLSKEDLKVLQIAALIHDIGKIEVPQEILNKREKLTDEEFKLLRMHPVYSAEIIEPFTNLSKLHHIVKHHHERYDGFGYPDKIKGEEILLEARILTVADSFDAMMSNRPYKNALSIDDAIEEMKLCSGTQFDGSIINLFIDIIKNENRRAK